MLTQIDIGEMAKVFYIIELPMHILFFKLLQKNYTQPNMNFVIK